jgi:hypothetical protein
VGIDVRLLGDRWGLVEERRHHFFPCIGRFGPCIPLAERIFPCRKSRLLSKLAQARRACSEACCKGEGTGTDEIWGSVEEVSHPLWMNKGPPAFRTRRCVERCLECRDIVGFVDCWTVIDLEAVNRSPKKVDYSLSVPSPIPFILWFPTGRNLD